MDGMTLPNRPGPRPITRRTLPHTQVDQQPTDPMIRAELARRAFNLAGVREAASGISVPGARALVLDGCTPAPGDPAFLVHAEFAHLHPSPDFSLHMTLPEPTARHATATGWAEFHPFVELGKVPPTLVMVFAPRDSAELAVVWRLLRASHEFATTPPSVNPSNTQPTNQELPMQHETINPWTWQDQFGYSQAVRTRDIHETLYCAGQPSIGPDGMPMHPGDMEAQIGQALDNLEAVLSKAGFGWEHVVRLNMYTTDVDLFFQHYGVLAGRMAAAGSVPSSTLLGVNRLAFPDLLVELEATAAR